MVIDSCGVYRTFCWKFVYDVSSLSLFSDSHITFSFGCIGENFNEVGILVDDK